MKVERTPKNQVIELRRYRLVPGARERLIELFERELAAPQEALGMRVLAVFRDLDDPNSFVWLRGFPDMPARAQALHAFYTGPVWTAHREAANATMVNSDNVLLLRPAGAGPELSAREPPGVVEQAGSVVIATTCFLAPRTDTAFAAFFANTVRPLLVQAGVKITAELVSEHSPNTFPRLPVREGETVFVWFSSFPDLSSYAAFVKELARSKSWTTEVLPEMNRRTWRANEILRLCPTPNSRLRRSALAELR